MKNLAFLWIVFSLYVFPLHAQERNVTVLTLNGAINPAASEYIEYGIKQAEKNNSECLILNLNTPGGLLESTRTIVSSILQSPVVIVVYVSPPGARAASAGVFITLAAHIAVMAPGTNIGAAHPVTLQGQMDSTMTEKVTNDAAAFIRTISEKRQRNIKWAEEAVRNSISITETEALKENVIDLISPNIDSLLIQINGRKIKTAFGEVTLNTTNAKIEPVNMSFSEKLLSMLSDPNIAYILLMLGFYGLLFELYSPGLIFPGIIGVISLVLAFYSMQSMPINFAGLALIIFAIILFILELKIVSHGLLTIGGVVSLILGSLMLIKTDSAFDVLTISWGVILVVALLTILFFLFAIGAGLKAQKRKPTTGVEGLINETAEVITDLNPNGLIKIHGEIWNAESSEGTVQKGTKVIIVSVSDLKLMVKKFV
jgi:membrane-bound serine protease (ClpP class)